jgi:hypothetical protein
MATWRMFMAARPFRFREASHMRTIARYALSISAASMVFAASAVFYALTQSSTAEAATPEPSASPETQGLTISWPTHIDISARSAAVFNGYNRGVGSITVIIRCDGTKSSFIPPTPDIDDCLRAVLTKFVADTQVTIRQPCTNQVFLVGFHVPSGDMTEVALPPSGH